MGLRDTMACPSPYEQPASHWAVETLLQALAVFSTGSLLTVTDPGGQQRVVWTLRAYAICTAYVMWMGTMTALVPWSDGEGEWTIFTLDLFDGFIYATLFLFLREKCAAADAAVIGVAAFAGRDALAQPQHRRSAQNERSSETDVPGDGSLAVYGDGEDEVRASGLAVWPMSCGWLAAVLGPAGSHRGHRGTHAAYSLGGVYVADTAGEVLLQVLNDCVIVTSAYIALAGAFYNQHEQIDGYWVILTPEEAGASHRLNIRAGCWDCLPSAVVSLIAFCSFSGTSLLTLRNARLKSTRERLEGAGQSGFSLTLGFALTNIVGVFVSTVTSVIVLFIFWKSPFRRGSLTGYMAIYIDSICTALALHLQFFSGAGIAAFFRPVRRHETIKVRGTAQLPALTLAPEHRYHVFISHSWDNQDAAATIKRQLQLLLPGIRIFLDVDDLQRIDELESLVGSSAALLVLLGSRAYFRSHNCLRELRTAIGSGRPLLLVHDREARQHAQHSTASHRIAPCGRMLCCAML